MNDVVEFAKTLEKDLIRLLKDFDIDVYPEFTISRSMLMQVVICSQQAMNDVRNAYPHTVTGLKHISNTCFWIMRLKPVNSSALRRGQARISDVAINEKLALYWSLQTILASIKDNKLRELVEHSDSNLERFRQVLRFFFKEDLYSNATAPHQRISGTNKFAETVHYCRFKKVTAVNLYETFMQLIMSVQMGAT